MKVKNKIDLWISLLLHGSMLILIPIAFTVPSNERIIMYITIALMALLIYPIFYGYCELREDEIFVRIGIFRSRIKYDNIKSIKLVTSYLSSMALTKDRIEIRVHDKGFVRGTTYIGPVNREDFLDELRVRCHNLEVSSDTNE